MSKVKVGLLGYGLAGSVFHAPLIQSCPDMELTAIGSRSFEGKDTPDGVETGSFDDVINNDAIDLIVIATPNTSHFPLGLQAISAGKHVVIDKPMAVRLSEVETLIARAADKDRLLSVFQNRRWDGGLRTAKSVVDGGELGDISYAEFRYDRFVPTVKKRWREEPAPGAGVLFDLGAHLIDQAYYLLGMPTAVTASVTAQREGAVVDDFFHIVLDYPTARVVLNASSLLYDHGPRIALYGDKAGFQHYGLDGQEDDLKAGKRPGDAGWGHMDNAQAVMLAADGSSRREIPSLNGAYETYYNGVAKAILTGAPLPVTPEDARNTFAILQAAVTSGIEKRTVALV
ncbi:Gfo/Idh/MocA family oxidoreductase [Litoreibacter albidus]|uniref:Scyllo-inositol 2-dehydrogenase (NADP+) n=1 Tax=Litoreibacter albidus TaxID=670155 RepID=A0A1H3CU58_9RHOB|nr:Gfo/Idh/MocA family oxidoreductase [Litoreibacter albidus]SDX57438.1 scyllo-inositol 2-dehydrogenase (NADP+) [Litoreibacter albidus]